MVVEALGPPGTLKAEETSAPLHLIFIEEPEALPLSWRAKSQQVVHSQHLSIPIASACWRGQGIIRRAGVDYYDALAAHPFDESAAFSRSATSGTT